MIKSISLISLGQHLLHCKYIPTSCNQNFFTKKLQLFMSWSIFLFVFSLKINETIHSIRIKQWVQQKQHITHRYSSTYNINADTDISLQMLVSITHRYGSTTVFTAFSIFIIPHFPCFSTFFSKKVGQPFHSKFPQSLDSTDFFIFVKIGSEVHRLFSRFFAVFGTFPCCFCSGSLDFTGLEVHRLFLQIF